jgi:hypothetical protein
VSYEIPREFAECLEWLTANFAEESMTEASYAALSRLEATTDPSRLLRAATAEPDPVADSGQLVVLPPLRRDWLVLMHLCHGSKGARDFLTISIVLATGDDCSTGWRFEAPEGPGEHCYWHAQPLQAVAGARLSMPEWLPESEPAIPVAACGPTELLVAALVAVYGHELFSLMQEQHGDDLRLCVDGLKCA